ncbi:hypothetical protein PtrM4_025260 [Pyrenophora tritici-repentis]|uniref:Uncharacterized protein n=1 Tax=Pyrenophora tritici-repentis TaxID=45151 RepID=A0A834VVK2_9PLEO|nr:hypothetical protein PtrM4_025260 [Pyrenophora tritici-repentis]
MVIWAAALLGGGAVAEQPPPPPPWQITETWSRARYCIERIRDVWRASKASDWLAATCDVGKGARRMVEEEAPRQGESSGSC